MLEINKKTFIFNMKEIHFADYPFDIGNCDVLTFQYCKNKADVKGFSFQKKHFTSIIDLTQDLDSIWQNMNRDTQRHILKAEKKGVKVQSSENYEEFYKIYKSFMKRKKISPLFGIFRYLGVGEVNINIMKKFGTLFLAEYNDEIISGRVYLEGDSSIKSWISASKRLEVDKMKMKLISHANRLLHWDTIKYAKEKQLMEYDFGGIFSKKEVEEDKNKNGIRNFKIGFGGEIVTCYQYQKIYSKGYKFLYNLYNLKSLLK